MPSQNVRGKIDSFFNPRSVAVVGASDKQGTLGNTILENLSHFSGKVYPVNPGLKEINGMTCYNSITDLPDVPDLSVVMVPAHFVPHVLEDHARKGVKAIIILSAGFAETGSARGRNLQDEAGDIASKSGMRVLGPNCLGIFDNTSRLDTFFVPGNLVNRPELGIVSLASQSGSFVGHVMDLASFEHLGIARVITYGNRLDVNEIDALYYFSRDNATKVVGLYIEGIERGREFIRAAKECSSSKPVVVLKTGRSEALQGGIMSHTGVLAGTYNAYKAAFRASGMYEVESMESFIDCLKALSTLPLAKGKRVLILGHAGGIGLTLADHCVAQGLLVPKLEGDLRASVKNVTLPYASVENPIDLTASGTDEQTEKVLMEAFVKEKDFADIAIYLALWGLPQSSEKIGETIASTMHLSGKPVIVATLFGRACLERRGVFEKRRVPVFLSVERAARVARCLYEQGNKNN